MTLCKICLGLTVFISFSSTALTLPPIPTEPIYYEPPVEQASQQQQSYSCAQLELAINNLHPYRYSYKPEYYQDNMNKVATTVLIIDSLPMNAIAAGAYLGYSALVDEKEARRMLTVEQQIAALQQVKAEKHCYE